MADNEELLQAGDRGGDIMPFLIDPEYTEEEMERRQAVGVVAAVEGAGHQQQRVGNTDWLDT